MRIDILDKEQEYIKDYEAFCAYNCIKHVLDYYGVKNPFIYLNTAINVSIREDENQESSVLLNLNFILPSYNKQQMEFIPKEKTASEVWKDNKKELDKGNVVITCVDIYELSYSEYYQKYHSNHCVILCGYTEDEKNVKIVDWYKWTFKGDVAIEEFLKARSSECKVDDSIYSGNPINNVWIMLKKEGWDGKPAELLKETIEVYKSNYYEMPVNSEDKEYHGIEAVRRMLELLLEYKMDDVKKKKVLDIVYKLSMILFKSLRFFRYYLEESSKQINVDGLTMLIEELNADVESWGKLLNTTVKGRISLNHKIYSRILQQANFIISREEKRYELLKKVYELL